MVHKKTQKNRESQKSKTNKFTVFDVIGLLAIIVIVVSFLTLGMRMTGYAQLTSTGVVNVTVNSLIAINFTANFINFSSGNVNPGQTNAVLDSNGTSAIGGTWAWGATNFTLLNYGNVNVTLQLKSGKTAATFLGGAAPAYKYSVKDAKAGSCRNPGVTLGDWNTVNTAGNGDTICGNFTPVPTADTIAINVQLTIPKDSSTGNLTDTFTATAT